jgi:hypothetical protein
MKFSDTTTKDGIIQAIETYCDLGDAYISGDTTRLREFTARVNRAMHRTWHSIFMYSCDWQYDDNNQTYMPALSTALVIDQRKYKLDSEALTIHRVEVKDENDNIRVLSPISKEMIKEGLDDFLDTSGDPKYYRLFSNVLEIFPASDYNQDASLIIYFDRASVEFVYNATTTAPGFASPYHEIIPVRASI